ncbi:methyltransferase domain-containing protein [Denitromonas ohlonensis]|uniref:Methyltransferase domain-containing protein n=2 Tax=Denitromonas TaxID=139331 RepID=A0A557R3U1_9RHOO|nr:methyltransferase domain-containing protein [Denitromonas ohlonensis]TVO59821.1 methyltransferase domain-containing protein [Denitromonas ohlonensis]TVO72932.1 methyltransferase domain-containing protein [Denitromonas ohlonensis]
MSSDFDARRFKAMERAGFNRIAAHYDNAAHLRASLQDALIAAAAPAPGEHWLDVASGPGLLARAMAPQLGPTGSVLATDIADGMLAHARRNIDAGNVLFAATDAERLCTPDGHFDGISIGLGLFVLPHPDKALAELRRSLKPGGRIALSVWGAAGSVPLIERAQQCIARLLPAPKVARPSVFRFGDPAYLSAMLSEAGFGRITLAPHDFHCRFATADAYWDAFLALAGGATEALSRLPADKQQALRAAVADDLADLADDDGYHVPASTLIATAIKP